MNNILHIVNQNLEQSLKKNLEINSMVDFFRETFTKDMMDNMKETTDFKNSFYDFFEPAKFEKFVNNYTNQKPDDKHYLMSMFLKGVVFGV